MATQSNTEIETIILNSSNSAKKFKHEYVTLEHLALSIAQYAPFKEITQKYGADIDGLITDLIQYLKDQTYLISTTNSAPRKTQSLERVFNRALTQVLFGGR